MLTRVVGVLRDAIEPIVVVAAEAQDLPALPESVRIVRDELPGRGPLQGLAAGLAALEGHVAAAFVSSCDVPLLRATFVKRMIELLGDHQACVPKVGEFFHPLAAVYRIEVLARVRQLLAADRLRTTDLLDEVTTRIVTADELRDVDPKLESLRNLNTPADYEDALRDAIS
jgi:molybdopterin-guanine dinucleotide biosynthesis protein A